LCDGSRKKKGELEIVFYKIQFTNLKNEKK